MLRIVASHRGHTDDTEAELATCELLFEERAGDPLTTAEANNLIENLPIARQRGGAMTQREKSQSIGVLMIVVFSAMLLWALTAVVWPVPVVYADDPEILTITVTSNLETYFYDPGLDPTGGTVYFNSVGGEGAEQVLTVTVTCSGMIDGSTFEGAPAFGDTPPLDTSAPWQVSYTVEAGVGTQSGIVFTVTNTITETDTAVITFTQDNVTPTVEFTDVTPGGYDEDDPDDWLDADGSNWYDGDFAGGIWEFTSDTADEGAGLASCAALWDHSSNTYDHSTSCTLSGDGSFSGLDNEDDGTVTVAVIVTDKVGNAASDSVLFNIDNTEPTITSPHISENSDYLYRADDLITIHYGDEMPEEDPVQTFTVNGSSNDTGVGLDRAEFSSAFGSTPDPDLTPSNWSGRYYPDNQDWGDGIITVTVTDLLDKAAEQTFYYFRDTEPPTVVVTSCPALTSEPSWDVSWNGQDPSPDSDVKHYDVQFSEVSPDGPWQDWHTDTDSTEDTFNPTSPTTMTDCYTYYFRVRAEDNVSNEGPYTNGEDATTYCPVVKEVFLPIIMQCYCGCGPDNYEPNDSCDQAYSPLTSGPTYQSWISCCDRATYMKSDYFYIDISTAKAVNIYLTDIPSGTDYDLYLYKHPCGPGNRVAKSEEPGTSPETISYSPPTTGRYYIRVYGYRGYSSSPYSLRVTYDQQSDG